MAILNHIPDFFSETLGFLWILIRYHVSAKYDFGDKAMLVMNGGRLDGQMRKNIGVVIVSAEAANMRLGVLCVAGVWVGFLEEQFSW